MTIILTWCGGRNSRRQARSCTIIQTEAQCKYSGGKIIRQRNANCQTTSAPMPQGSSRQSQLSTNPKRTKAMAHTQSRSFQSLETKTHTLNCQTTYVGQSFPQIKIDDHIRTLHPGRARVTVLHTGKITRSIITNTVSDRYSEHSQREYHEAHKNSWDWQDWVLILEALPGGSVNVQKRTRGEWDAGVENRQNTQINLINNYLPQTKYSRLSRFLGVCGGVGDKPDPSVYNSAWESFSDERGLAFNYLKIGFLE